MNTTSPKIESGTFEEKYQDFGKKHEVSETLSRFTGYKCKTRFGKLKWICFKSIIPCFIVLNTVWAPLRSSAHLIMKIIGGV